MRKYELASFGIDNLGLVSAPDPGDPGPGEVQVELKALSLNFRDVLVIEGAYNPRLPLPVTPVSDGAGVVTAVGPGVEEFSVKDRVMTHFVTGWIDGPFRSEYSATTLGTPGPGVAVERINLPVAALLPVPRGYDLDQAATLPIAALTAWSALVTEGELEAGQTVLTLGTGGVSLFACQLGKALGAQVLVTSSSDEKLDRVKKLGADFTVNYRENPRWDKAVLEITNKQGVDVVVENGGIGTLGQSLKAVRGGGTIALLGALTGLEGELNIAPILMKRIRVAGILVDSRSSFEDLVGFLEKKRIEPVIDLRFPFEELPDALRALQAGKHFGKIVVDL